jgi:hypothetical protein
MVETDPEEDDIWFGDPDEEATVFLCEVCNKLEAE